MGVIYQTIKVPNLVRYARELNPDGTEKHIICEGARFHVPYWTSKGRFCSEPNCEINRRTGEQNES